MVLTLLKKYLGPLVIIIVFIFVVHQLRRRFTFFAEIPVGVFVFILVAAIVIWAVILFVKWRAEKRRAQAIEEGILDQAQAGIDQATPARKAEIQQLKANLTEALAILKQGPQGKKALYTLPWYMIIGPPAVGKTTVIKNSNLNFPGMSTAKWMRGTGGTRNCDWWLSSDAILLDTAGRYADAADRSETEEEWFSFLDLLKGHRKKRPIDGLILAFSIEDFYQKDEVSLIESARELRQRMDEILDRLGWTFPVYLLFTKCDLISGFTDYFSSLSPVERHQVLGAVYSPEPEGNQRAMERFSGEFDTLLSNIRTMRTRRMSSVSRSEDWGRVFMFPEEFTNLKDKLALFIETMFEANPYRRDVPIFRGTYFSSGRQMGKPFDQVVQKIQSMLGSSAGVEEAQEQEEKDDAYFVRDLFTKVLKTDQDLVRITGDTARRRSRIALIASATSVMLGILACLWVGYSYVDLKRNMNEIKIEAGKTKTQGTVTATDIEELERLEPLRKLVDDPWTTFPLAVTDTVHVTAEIVYHRAITNRILMPLEKVVAGKLRDSRYMKGWEIRRVLKTELMLLHPEKKDLIGWDASDLTRSLYAFGLEGVSKNEEARQKLFKMVELFIDMKKPVVAHEERQNELQKAARQLLATHTTRGFLESIIDEIDQTNEPLVLGDFVGKQGVMKNRESIQYAYTGSGWNDYVQPHINKALEVVEADYQLVRLVGEEVPQASLSTKDMFELYGKLYRDGWVNFIEGTKLAYHTEIQDFSDDLWALRNTGKSPLFQMLRSVAAQSELGSDLDLEVSDASEVIQGANSNMSPLTDFVTEPDDTPLLEYAKQVENIFDQIDSCMSNNDIFDVDTSVLNKFSRSLGGYMEEYQSTRMALAMRELLNQPLERSRIVFEKEKQNKLDRRREAQQKQLQDEWAAVHGSFKDNLKSAYPFSMNSDKKAERFKVTDLFNGINQFSGSKDNNSIGLGPKTRTALDAAEKIRHDMGMDAEGFGAIFTLTSLGVQPDDTGVGREYRNIINTITLTINEETLEDFIRNEDRLFEWSSESGLFTCQLTLKSKDGVVASIESDDNSAWSICRFFDKATVTRDGNSWIVVWPFPEQDIGVKFRLTSRDNADLFFLRGSNFRSFTMPSEVTE